MKEKIILEDNVQWKAIIDIQDTYICLCFEDENGATIWGNVDGTIGFKDIKTNILDLTLFADDGSFIIDYSHINKVEIEKNIEAIIALLKTIYYRNKNKFRQNIEQDLEKNRDIPKDGIVHCQSCYKPLKDKKKKFCDDCFANGQFRENLTIEQMAERLSNDRAYVAIKDVAIKMLIEKVLPQLDRWKQN
jgi:hypothetical protein